MIMLEFKDTPRIFGGDVVTDPGRGGGEALPSKRLMGGDVPLNGVAFSRLD